MALSNVQASSVNFSFQYASVQLSASSQTLGDMAGSQLPVVVEQEEGGEPGGFAGQFQGLAQTVQLTFSQLGINLSEQRGGGAGAERHDFTQALHAFTHALFGILKELDAFGEKGGKPASHLDRYGPAVQGAAVSYTGISLELDILVNNLDSAATSDISGSADSSMTAANTSAATDVAIAENADSRSNPLGKLQSTFRHLLHMLDGNSSSGSQASLKDFLKAFQKNLDGNAQPQQFSFSLSVAVGSFVYTQA